MSLFEASLTERRWLVAIIIVITVIVMFIRSGIKKK
jgi:hypothetical protein